MPQPEPPSARAPALIPLAGDHLLLARDGEVLHPPSALPETDAVREPLPGDGAPLAIVRWPQEAAAPEGLERIHLAEAIGGLHRLEPADLPERLAAWVNGL